MCCKALCFIQLFPGKLSFLFMHTIHIQGSYVIEEAFNVFSYADVFSLLANFTVNKSTTARVAFRVI